MEMSNQKLLFLFQYLHNGFNMTFSAQLEVLNFEGTVAKLVHQIMQKLQGGFRRSVKQN